MWELYDIWCCVTFLQQTTGPVDVNLFFISFDVLTSFFLQTTESPQTTVPAGETSTVLAKWVCMRFLIFVLARCKKRQFLKEHSLKQQLHQDRRFLWRKMVWRLDKLQELWLEPFLELLWLSLCWWWLQGEEEEEYTPDCNYEKKWLAHQSSICCRSNSPSPFFLFCKETLDKLSVSSDATKWLFADDVIHFLSKQNQNQEK